MKPEVQKKLEQFLKEIEEINFENKLNQNPFANPNINYKIFIDILIDSKKKYLPKKRVKFNKKKNVKHPT